MLEMLEDRLAPATLHWIGSSTAPVAELPGLVGEYWQNYPDATNILVKTDPSWIGQNPPPFSPPDVIAVTDDSTSPYHPSVLTFNNINGTSGFQPYADFSATDPGANHTVARWGGQIFIATAGNVSFQTGADDGSILYIDGKLVVNDSNYFPYGQGTITLTAGYHDFDEEWYNGGGGANIYTNWDPAGGSAFVPITNAVLFHQATRGNWSDPTCWAEHATPHNGDTLVFDTSTAGFVPQALVPPRAAAISPTTTFPV